MEWKVIKYPSLSCLDVWKDMNGMETDIVWELNENESFYNNISNLVLCPFFNNENGSFSEIIWTNS